MSPGYAAHSAHGTLGFFEQVAIFQTPSGKFCEANLKQFQYNKREAAALAVPIKRLTGYKLVSFSSGLGWWIELEKEQSK